MKYFCLFAAFGFWISIAIKDVFYVCLFIMVFSLFLMYRFKRKLIVIIWALFTVCFVVYINKPIEEPQPGQYMIYEIKPKYCLARKDNVSIIVYGIEDPEYYDVYKISEFEKVNTIKNIGQFVFEEYLHKQSIYYSANVSRYMYIRTENSIKNDVYNHLKNRKHANFYLSNFYGICNEDVSTILINLGLPILGVISILRKFLLRLFSKNTSEIIIFLLAILYGSIFTFTPSLVRITLFLLGKIVFSKWEYQLSFSTILFLMVLPGFATEFIFLFPVCAMLVYRFCHDLFKRIFLIRILLMTFQFIYFHSVDIVLFLGFSILRKLNSLVFFISLVSLFYEPILTFILDIYDGFIMHLPSLVINYAPGFLFIIVIFWLVYEIYNDHRFIYLLCICLIMIFCSNYLNPFFNVYMLDIGQGDCTLIVEPFMRSAVMIDCGQNLYRDNVEEIIDPFLKARHISKLDALILTHEDFDHSGGLEALKEKVEIKQIVQTSNQKVDVDYPFFSLLEDRKSNNENDNSVISYFIYDGIQYLWTGDAGIEIEEQFMKTYPKLEVDVLKLGHHGSSTSSSYAFLKEIQPQLGLISVGANNRYGHPDNEVISNCTKLNIDLLMTKDVGMIHIFTFKGIAFFRTQTGLFGILES